MGRFFAAPRAPPQGVPLDPLLRNVLGGRDGSKERRRGIQTMRPPFYLPNCLYEADDNQISSADLRNHGELSKE